MSGQGLLQLGLPQLGELTLAFVLSALVGLEREVKQKSAGLRTYALVGVSAALFMIVSKHGFDTVLRPGLVVLDPSRVAAQVVSGIGFIGGGVIFMRRDVVRGLTTAASIWLTAALGMACGAGLPVLAVATTAGHFVIMLAFPRLVRRLPRWIGGRPQRVSTELRISYEDGRGLLRRILIVCTERRFAIDHVRIDRDQGGAAEAAQDLADVEGVEPERAAGTGTVGLYMQVKGKRPVSHLIAALADIDGVREVGTAGEESGLD